MQMKFCFALVLIQMVVISLNGVGLPEGTIMVLPFTVKVLWF